MATNYKRLVGLYESKSASEADSLLREHFQAKEVNAKDIDLGRLFCECYGWNEFVSCRSGGQSYPAHEVMARARAASLTEAEGAVGTDAFLHIIGQIAYSTTLDGYNLEEGPISSLIPEVQTKFLDGEKIAGLSNIGPDEIKVRNEARPYALAGFGEDWIRTPVTKDRGMIVPATWEAVFADRTGLFLEHLNSTGRMYKYHREELATNCLIDENTTAHRYNWKDTVIASYGNNSGSHSWDNLAETNALLDWSSLNTAEQVFNAITDPYTGKATVWEARHLVVTKQNEQTARRILRAGEIRVVTPGYATTGNPTQTNVANPYSNKYDLVTSRILAAQLATDTDWFLGDVSKYAKYMVVRPFEVVNAPSGLPEEFHSRIIAQSRVSEHAAFVCVQPRAVVKNTVA